MLWFNSEETVSTQDLNIKHRAQFLDDWPKGLGFTKLIRAGCSKLNVCISTNQDTPSRMPSRDETKHLDFRAISQV